MYISHSLQSIAKKTTLVAEEGCCKKSNRPCSRSLLGFGYQKAVGGYTTY